MVLHPDSIFEFQNWNWLRGRALIENMSTGKFGSSLTELRIVFDRMPEAGFCLDLGHARQVDPTMGDAHLMIDAFGDRLRQVHISDVDKNGKHYSLSRQAMADFRQFAPRIPLHIPIIIESTGLDGDTNELYHDEVSRVRLALSQ
jgi:sugar phosphate isomerase/epimerase